MCECKRERERERERGRGRERESKRDNHKFKCIPPRAQVHGLTGKGTQRKVLDYGQGVHKFGLVFIIFSWSSFSREALVEHGVVRIDLGCEQQHADATVRAMENQIISSYLSPLWQPIFWSHSWEGRCN